MQKINLGIEVIVFAFQYPFRKEIYRWRGIEVHAFNGQNRGKLKRLLMWNAVWKRLRKMKVERELVGILCFWCGECALVGTKFGRRHRVRHFNWIMGQDARETNNYVKLISPLSEELIAISDSAADEFYRNHQIRPAFIVSNSIETNLILPPLDFARGKLRAQRDIDILGAGSLIPLKQYDLFIKIVSELNVSANIAGEGPERHYLEELIHQYKLHEKVSLLGEIEHSRLMELMSRTKVFLHPSNYEGFSSVCLEALAAGAHVVSFCKPMKENIDHWHIVKDEEEMRSKVLELIKDQNLDHAPVVYLTSEGAAEQVSKLFLH